MTTHLLESDVMNACRTLFGPGPDIDRGFLFYLQPCGAKSAYRKKAKETHPDFFYTEDHHVQQQKAALFRKIMEAYEIVNKFLRERKKGQWVHNKATAAKSAPKHNNDAYYSGSLPLYSLEIGSYLFYAGQISYWQLIEALTWQRKQRLIIGSVALRWGWLIKPSIERITSARNLPGRFGEKAVRLGLLSDFQVRTLLSYQRLQQERLGKYFIMKKILTSDQLDHFVQKAQEHNERILAPKKAA